VLIGSLIGVLVSVVVAASIVVPLAENASARDVNVDAFRGLGTWVDVFDYVPAIAGDPAPITVDSVDDMERLGIQTLYLQAAQDDARIPGPTVDPKLLGAFLRRAHDAGMKVVAWYVPKLVDVAADLRRIRALHSFRSRGESFDGIALDLESTSGVPDPKLRNDALVELSRRARSLVGKTALGAVVLEPVLLEQVNTNYWPSFPWRHLHDFYDVWLPMTYWTNRDKSSGLRDGYTYTNKNIKLVRKRLRDAGALVHPIGGIANDTTTADDIGFVRAARADHAIGWSLYDFNTTTSGVWARLRHG
jgi:hypothetical protein